MTLDSIKVYFDIDGLLEQFTAAWAIKHNYGPCQIQGKFIEDGSQIFWVESGTHQLWTVDMAEPCRQAALGYKQLTEMYPDEAVLQVGKTDFEFVTKEAVGLHISQQT